MFKRSQNACWYVTINGRQHNLGRDEWKAKAAYSILTAQHRPPDLDAPVSDLIDRFLTCKKANRAPARFRATKSGY
jgi:hypothetical protein